MSLLQNVKTKPPAKSAALILSWILILLVSRFVLANFFYAEKDARALWAEISSYIPKEKYEIVTLDRRADGLLFYGAVQYENVTRKDNPYPTFSIPKTLDSKIAEITRGNQIYLFIIQKQNKFESTLELLKTHFGNIKTVTLKHKKWLIIIDPKKSF